MKKLKLSDRLSIILLTIILGILFYQAIASHISIEQKRKEKTEQPENMK